MAYTGQAFKIPMGLLGMSTDNTQDRMPNGALLEARNIDFYDGMCATEFGSLKWNTSALSAGITATHDFWPTDITQRVLALTRDGVLHKFLDRTQNITLGPASSTDVQKLVFSQLTQPMLVQGGAVNGDNRKVFLFTGSSVVQVVDGDATVRRNISKPSADWSGSNQPSAGVIHNGRLAAWGNQNLPHMLYLSSATDHEDFQTNGAFIFFNVFPGEGERLMGCHNYKGRLFIFKYPKGVYYLDDSDPSTANWFVRKLNGAFGAASAFSFIEALDDFYVASAQGSVTSLQATLNFGSMTAGNLLRTLRNEGYMRKTTARNAYNKRYAMWYEEKKIAYFAYQSSGGVKNDRLLKIDFNDEANGPKVSWSDKDQPNCLFLKKDTINILRPCYGADDGYIYEMDHPDFSVGGNAYTSSFKTINLDFGTSGATALTPVNPELAEREKLYDFLEITFEEAGNWNLSVDVYIDNYFSETVTLNMTHKQYLGNFYLGPTGKNQVLGRSPQQHRIPIHGKGRRIALKCYISNLRQYFRISEIAVYYRLAGQAEES